jgi:hypothetical protein
VSPAVVVVLFEALSLPRLDEPQAVPMIVATTNTQTRRSHDRRCTQYPLCSPLPSGAV